MVTTRYREIYAGQRKSEIVITKTAQEEAKTIQADVIAEEIAKVKADLEKKIRAEIEAEMKANIKVENVEQVETKFESIEKINETKIPTVENKPQAGRPKKY